MSVSKIVPPSWDYTVVTILKKTDSEVIIKLEPVRQPIEMDEDSMR